MVITGKNIGALGVLVCGLVLMAGQIAAQNIVAKTESGKVMGAVEGGVVSFKCIPFAAPPLGDLRWCAPQPVKPWTGVRAATKYSSDCMQLPFPSNDAPLGSGVDEDCLYMNVWKPATPSSAKLPVMVWIYGGGFVNGGSSPLVYAGNHFAENGVVFVSSTIMSAGSASLGIRC